MRLGPRLVASASTAARMAERLRTTSPVRKCMNLSANPVQPSTSASKSVMWTLGKKLLSSHLSASAASGTSLSNGDTTNAPLTSRTPSSFPARAR